MALLLSLGLGVVALALEGGAELDGGDEEGARLADGLEVAVELDGSCAEPLPSMRRWASWRSLVISDPSASAGSWRGWSYNASTFALTAKYSSATARSAIDALGALGESALYCSP